MTQNTYDDINIEIYSAMDRFMMDTCEDDFDSEEEWFGACAEQAIDKVVEDLKEEIKVRWGIYS